MSDAERRERIAAYFAYARECLARMEAECLESGGRVAVDHERPAADTTDLYSDGYEHHEPGPNISLRVDVELPFRPGRSAERKMASA